jgi:hypothetical protein
VGIEEYFKKANDFAFLKTRVSGEKFLRVFTRNFGGEGFPLQYCELGNRTGNSELKKFSRDFS